MACVVMGGGNLIYSKALESTHAQIILWGVPPLTEAPGMGASLFKKKHAADHLDLCIIRVLPAPW
jgi:hypothetical protein